MQKTNTYRDGQIRENLPLNIRVLLGASSEVGRQQCPRPSLGNSSDEPDRHWEEPLELAEDHLLPGLSGDRIEEQFGGSAVVKVG